MHYLLIYTGAPDYLEKRPLYREEHLRLTWAAVERGELVLGGATGEPVDGATMLWRGDSPKAAEDFAAADPYVTNGLVTKWEVKPWDTVVGYHASNPVGSQGAPGFAIPVLPSRNIDETLEFFKGLGAQWTLNAHDNTYGLVQFGAAELHFYKSDDKQLAEMSCCRVIVGDINYLYDLCAQKGIVHPNGKLGPKPWGTIEFAILDPTGVLYTFAQQAKK